LTPFAKNQLTPKKINPRIKIYNTLGIKVPGGCQKKLLIERPSDDHTLFSFSIAFEYIAMPLVPIANSTAAVIDNAASLIIRGLTFIFNVILGAENS
jgi:hypothetical protein